jgi:hypothetical protein
MKTLVKALLNCPATLGFAFLFTLCSYNMVDTNNWDIKVGLGVVAFILLIFTLAAATAWRNEQP